MGVPETRRLQLRGYTLGIKLDKARNSFSRDAVFNGIRAGAVTAS